MSVNGIIYRSTTFTIDPESQEQQEWFPRHVVAIIVQAARRQCNVSLVLLRKLLPLAYYFSLTIAAFVTGFIFVILGVRGFRKEPNFNFIIMGGLLFMIGLLFITLVCKYSHFIYQPENTPASSNTSTLIVNPSHEHLFIATNE